MWKTIPWYPKYKCSDQWEVKSLNFNKTWKEKLLKPYINKKWYVYISLHNESWFKRVRMHRIIVQTFLDTPLNAKLDSVHHIDNNREIQIKIDEWEDRIHVVENAINNIDTEVMKIHGEIESLVSLSGMVETPHL